MRSSDGEALRSPQELRLEHRLWLHRRLARGLAHELANLQQMLLLPAPPLEIRDELDARLAVLVDTLGRAAREPDVDPGPGPHVMSDAWSEAARAHEQLGGEPRVSWTVVPPSAPPTTWVRAEALHRVLVTVLVLAGRSLDGRAHGAAELRVETGAGVRLVADVPSAGATPDAEDAWLAACAEAWLEGEGGRLLVEHDGVRTRLIVQLPDARRLDAS